MGWFRVVDGHLRYCGLNRAPFAEWSATPRGRATVAAARRHVRLSLFGRDRAARSRLWRELKAVASDGRVAAVLTEQARVYHTVLASFAFVEALPRTTVDLRRLVVVPRSLVNVRCHAMLSERFADLALDNSRCGGAALRDFLVVTLVDEMDRAFLASRPAVGRPVPAADGWVTVGVDVDFVWVKPYWTGPGWEGHHYLYELPRGGLTWRQRKRVETAMRQVAVALESCSRAERHETLQCAAAGLKV